MTASARARSRGPRPESVPAAWSLGLGLLALLGYLALAPHVASEGDGNEFALVLARFGVAHPTGYPLYTLLGGAFCALLHGAGASWWFAANAWSAVGAGLAVALFHALAARLLPLADVPGRAARFGAALLPTGLLALHPLWLNEATLAEVHSWHVAWLAGAGLICLAGIERADRGAAGRGVALGWGLVSGAGLAHHATSAFFVVPLTFALGWSLRRSGALRDRLVVMGAAGALVVLASDSFVLYRAFHPAAYQWPLLEPSLASVFDHLRGARFGKLLGGFAASEAQRALLATNVVPLLAVGAALLAARGRAADPAARPLLAALVAGALLEAGFIRIYGVVDPGPYFLPLLVVALLGVGLLGAWVARHAGHPVAPLALALLVIALAAPPWVRTARERDARLVQVERRVRAAWRSIPDRAGVVFWRNDLYVRLRAYQLLDGEKPGLDVENPALLTWDAPRRAFERRTGVDPLAGLELRSDEDLDAVPGNVRRQTALPVVDFARVLARTP